VTLAGLDIVTPQLQQKPLNRNRAEADNPRAMDLHLRDKTALVTGGSRGIGLAIARVFHEEGARVIICSRNPRHLVAAAKEIGEITAMPCDVTKPRDVRALLKRTGPLDVLVNNAGGMEHYGKFAETTAESWRRALELNVVSAVELARAARPGLAERAGCVINIASEAGRQPLRIGPDYSAAKAALLSATKSLANELAPEGIRVNAICPGPVMTDSWVTEARARGGARWQSFLKRASAHAAGRVPLGRMGTPDDVAALAVFVASPKASWITGAAFAVDGGAVRVI